MAGGLTFCDPTLVFGAHYRPQVNFHVEADGAMQIGPQGVVPKLNVYASFGSVDGLYHANLLVFTNSTWIPFPDAAPQLIVPKWLGEVNLYPDGSTDLLVSLHFLMI